MERQKRQKINKTQYLAAFTITLLIFILGITLGNFFSDIKINQLQDLEREIKLDALGAEMQFLILVEDPCNAINSSVLTEQLYILSEKLTYMENQMGFDNKNVLSLKEEYSLLQIRHWLLIRKSKELCDNELSSILYFYSNKGDCPDCEHQGGVLTYIRKKHPETNIYAFDINIQNPALDTLKKLYIHQNETPILIINEQTHYGKKDSKEIQKILFNTTGVRIS